MARRWGAELTIMPSKSGGMDAVLTRAMIEAARQITEATGAFWTDQLANNADQLTAYHAMAEEIWAQTGKGGSTPSSRPNGPHRCAAWPKGCGDTSPASISSRSNRPTVGLGAPSGSHKIEGAGAASSVPLWHAGITDEIATVSTGEAMAMRRHLAREEALLCRHLPAPTWSPRSGWAAPEGPTATIVAYRDVRHFGIKYISTALYAA